MIIFRVFENNRWWTADGLKYEWSTTYNHRQSNYCFPRFDCEPLIPIVVVHSFKVLIVFHSTISGWFESFQVLQYLACLFPWIRPGLLVCQFFRGSISLRLPVEFTDTFYNLLIIILSYISNTVCPDFVGRVIFELFIW